MAVDPNKAFVLDKIEKAQASFTKAVESMKQMVEMKDGMWAGHVLGKRARTANSYIQDGVGQLKRLAEGISLGKTQLPAFPEPQASEAAPKVAPPAKVERPKVVLNELGGDCPVCQTRQDLLLYVVLQSEGKPDQIQLSTCLDCIKTHKSAALHGTYVPSQKTVSIPAQEEKSKGGGEAVLAEGVSGSNGTITILEKVPLAVGTPKEEKDPFLPEEDEVLRDGEIVS